MCNRSIGPFPCCSIIHGDSAELLSRIAGESVPLVITDPPYGMSYVSGRRTYGEMSGDEQFPRHLVREAIGKASHAAYCFCRWDNIVAGDLPKPSSVLTWIKHNWGMGDRNHHHGRQWEAICFYSLPEHSFLKQTPDVVYATGTGNVFHPTEKPLDLIKRLIACNEGDTVLDPFCGSGTTCVAAQQLGRHFLGFEIDEKYYRIALLRTGCQSTSIIEPMEGVA
jgi:site-specific DNA-methyltransferase (adenine-specific)